MPREISILVPKPCEEERQLSSIYYQLCKCCNHQVLTHQAQVLVQVPGCFCSWFFVLCRVSFPSRASIIEPNLGCGKEQDSWLLSTSKFEQTEPGAHLCRVTCTNATLQGGARGGLAIKWQPDVNGQA